MLRARPLAVDAAVAVSVTAGTVLATLRPPVGWPAVLIGLAASAPVLWRRRAIVPVALVVGCATTGLSIVDRLPPLPYGMLVCTYTFATLASTRLRRSAVALAAIGVAGSLWLTGEPLDSYGYVGMAYAGAYALGAGTRARETQVAMLRERSRRLEQDQVAATQRERARIARDMHDVLGHTVTMVAVAAEAGPLTVRTDPERAEMLFAAISATAREALGQIRRTVSAMRLGESPDDTADLAAIADLVTQAGATGLDAHLVEHGSRQRVPADVGVAAYRIAQESLTNTIRHARASSVQVGLDWTGSALLVEIRDDGNPEPVTLGGYGLAGMRERAAACGGTLSAGPAPGGGFLVRAELPLS
jgi:signal transduction histidine kinase